MAAAAAAARGSGGAAQQVTAAIRDPHLQKFSAAVGDTVEAQMGGNWTRVLVVAVQEDGYLVSVSDGAPQISVQKIRKGVFFLLFFHFLSLLLIFFFYSLR